MSACWTRIFEALKDGSGTLKWVCMRYFSIVGVLLVVDGVQSALHTVLHCRLAV